MSTIQIEHTHGAAVDAKIAAGIPIMHCGGRLPVGRFTAEEFAGLLARLHKGVTFEDGVITVPGPDAGLVPKGTA